MFIIIIAVVVVVVVVIILTVCVIQAGPLASVFSDKATHTPVLKNCGQHFRKHFHDGLLYIFNSGLPEFVAKGSIDNVILGSGGNKWVCAKQATSPLIELMMTYMCLETHTHTYTYIYISIYIYIPRPQWVNSSWPSDTIHMASENLMNTGSDNGLVPNEPMLTNFQGSLVAFTWQQFHVKCSLYPSLIWAWKWRIYD